MDYNLEPLRFLKTKKNNYNLSDSNFINLYDFAVAIHASYVDLCKESKESLNILFGELPLEFKISNIQLAKSYSQKLALINCFYSSKELDYPLVESFEIDEYGNEDSTDLEILSRDEHVRWVREKINHGWKYGEKNGESSVCRIRSTRLQQTNGHCHL